MQNDLDAGPQPSGFPYSTFGRPFVAEKAQHAFKPWYRGLWAFNVKKSKQKGSYQGIALAIPLSTSESTAPFAVERTGRARRRADKSLKESTLQRPRCAFCHLAAVRLMPE